MSGGGPAVGVGVDVGKMPGVGVVDSSGVAVGGTGVGATPEKGAPGLPLSEWMSLHVDAATTQPSVISAIRSKLLPATTRRPMD
jgi:hypothetical protein